MTCPACAAQNSAHSLYCSQCAEPLTAFAISRQKKKELRDKKTREYELTEDVAGRLLKWSKLLGSVLTILALIFSILLGKAYLDLQKGIDTGKTAIANAVKDGNNQISTSTAEARAEIEIAQKELPSINTDIQQLKLDVSKYKAVNNQIEKLQSDFLHLQTNIIDLGNKTLRVGTIESTGTGASMISFGTVGCSPEKAKGSPISFCVNGAPLALNSMTDAGRVRPVASFSEIGFQDVSTGPRPPCDGGSRGTVYIQKGQSHQPDRPFICVKDQLDSFVWLQISTAQ
jgi:hypothetical protein